MSRLFFRHLNGPGLILLAMLAVAVQTSVFATYPLIYLQPDFLLLGVIWFALKRDFIEGGILTLIFSEVAEIHSGAPRGLYYLCYMTVYFTVRTMNRYVLLPSLTSMVGLALLSSVLWKLTGLGVLHMMDLAGNQWRHTLALLLPGAVMEAVVAVWVFRWLDKYDWVTYKNPRARQMLEDELLLGDEGL